MKSSWWASWAWPIVVLVLVLVKAIGLITGIVAVSTYFALKPKFGVGIAVAVSCALALLTGVVVVAMLEVA